MPRFIRPFADLTLEDLPAVGGKNAALGEMVRELGARGVPVPGGFAVTAEGYRLHLERHGLVGPIEDVLAGLDATDTAALARAGRRIRALISGAELPAELAGEIAGAYRELGREHGDEAVDVAVRSSATAEDLPEASFAGQQETFLNVRGETALFEACRKCFASLFTDRAIAYRTELGFGHLQVALSVGVQKMVRSDLAASGVLFTLDTETGFRDVVLINSAYGLGENVVRGVVNPDEFYVFKPTLREGFRPILQKRLGSKELKMVYEARGGSVGTRNVPVPERDRERFSITDDEVLRLARWGLVIEDHFSARAGSPRPMDVEWAKDGRTGELFVLQARPETVQAVKDRSCLERFQLTARGPVLVRGKAVGSRIGQGPVRPVRSREEMAAVEPGDVLVAEMTDPDWVPVMKRAAAIVTERGGRTCHAAIVSRELGLPAVVGASGALSTLETGAEVTVSCAEGETGVVYAGRLPFEVERVAPAELPPTRTAVMMNVAEPDLAFELAAFPADGVGLARMEFIIGTEIRVHPMALLKWPRLESGEAVEEIAALTRGYPDKPEYFVDRLSQGVAKIAAAFHPKPVILRLSDFKSNEYAGLVGGRELEPVEENPMLGFRGASRYVHPRYAEAFALECAAVRRVRGDMGLGNLQVMIPFCRTPEEGRRVVAALAAEGLVRGEQGLELYVMCEIPANVLQAAELCEVFDGFSIGSNDLTQLLLGVDRDSELVADLFDERNPAVLTMIRQVIAEVRSRGRKIGICGQAPSDYPEFAEFLVSCGIDSISVTPDALVRTRLRVAEAEGRGRVGRTAGDERGPAAGDLHPALPGLGD
ncbi:MAG TPA: phosphoenolpyruvate synthase [Thermoanaerobaculia bacterium]|nr:phosphoenolpyruvate synthase [Thermoanaerobaculia bacterium]